MAEPTHLDAAGKARMVDLSGKPETERHARAGCRVRLGRASAEALKSGRAAKGDAIAAARLAGISAAKRAADLIPLCHPLRVGAVGVDLGFEDETTVAVTADVSGIDRSGFEMEALVAASVAALTLYDMLKAVDKGISITDLRLLEKSGGKSGRWTRGEG